MSAPHVRKSRPAAASAASAAGTRPAWCLHPAVSAVCTPGPPVGAGWLAGHTGAGHSGARDPVRGVVRVAPAPRAGTVIARADAAGTHGNAARRATVIAAVALCLLLVARLADAFSTAERGQAAFVAALFVLPLLYAFPGPRRLLARHRWPLLAAQGVLTYIPFALFGAHWAQGVSGLLAGLVLLTLPGRLSWPLAGLLLVAEVALRAGVVGLPYRPAHSAAMWVVIVFVDDCLIYFGLVKLADLVAELQSARGQHAELAVARERLQAAENLRAAIGERLAEVAAMAAAARRALPRDPDRARGQIEAAGVTARDAIARARATADHRGPSGPEPAAPAAGAFVAPRVAWVILVVMVCGFGVQLLNDVYLSNLSPGNATAVIAGTVAGVALQLHHSRHAPGGGRPRAWPLTLAIQTALVYVPYALLPVHYVGGLPGFAAGSFLLLVPGRWRWAGYAAVVASWSALYATVPQVGLTPHPGPADVLYVTAAAAGVGLMVYGLAWLAGAARQMEALRGEQARMAVLAERLRVARDVHDLLGLGLSAIALKADLIGRLIGRADARAAAETAEMGRICAAVRADMRLVTDASGQLRLDAELAAAREILASAGVDVRAETGPGPLPAAADSVLAPVLREAVTNILRHSAATAAAIEVTTAGGVLRLHVSNDGVPDRAAAGGPAWPLASGDGGGRGLANLTARVRAAGGRLTFGNADGRFGLSAELPLPVPPGLSPAAGSAAGPVPGGGPGWPAVSR
jgi:two-component system, NarL family, sensor histidine kinase DesK